MNIDEWWESQTPEFRSSIKSHYGLDVDWFRAYLPAKYHSAFTPKWDVIIKRIHSNIFGAYDFLITLINEEDEIIIAEKLRISWIKFGSYE